MSGQKYVFIVHPNEDDARRLEKLVNQIGYLACVVTPFGEIVYYAAQVDMTNQQIGEYVDVLVVGVEALTPTVHQMLGTAAKVMAPVGLVTSRWAFKQAEFPCRTEVIVRCVGCLDAETLAAAIERALVMPDVTAEAVDAGYGGA